MPGLNFGTYGGVSVRSQANSAPASSITSAAFGPGYTESDPNGLGSALTPDDAFGHAFWFGVLAIGLLVFIRQSLPR